MHNSQASICDLYAEERQGLRRHVARRLGNQCDAEDIVQEAYVRMLTIAPDHARLRNAKAFLFTVASNLTVDAIRREQRSKRLFQFTADSSDGADAEREEFICPLRSIEDQVDGGMRVACVVAALEELPDSCRRAFIMHKFQELSYAEVASEMGVTVSMVEKHLARALNHLRESPELDSWN